MNWNYLIGCLNVFITKGIFLGISEHLEFFSWYDNKNIRHAKIDAFLGQLHFALFHSRGHYNFMPMSTHDKIF